MKHKIKKLFSLFCGVVGFIYILNPTAGIIELIPDNLPLIGNLDETAAILLVLGSLRHFGIDLTNFLRFEKKNR